MTKARDIASASPAPSTVSTTELGYLDGVTSNIQTQFSNISGSKAQPTEPSSPTDGMIWVDTDGSTTDANFIPKTLTSTTGDIIYASSANTPARLGIGSTSQVLTVSGGVPTWAAPAAAGMTSLATGTLSGSGVTLDNISQDYVHLQLILTDVNVANSGDKVYARLENSSQTYYAQGGQTVSVSGTTPTLGTINKFDSLIELNAFSTSSGNQVNQVVFNVYNYTAAGVYNMGDWQSVFIRNTGGNEATTKGFWSYNNTGLGAISRLDIFGDSTFNGGTYTLYGVK